MLLMAFYMTSLNSKTAFRYWTGTKHTVEVFKRLHSVQKECGRQHEGSLDKSMLQTAG